MYTNLQCQWSSQATTFSGNQWYTCTHTKTMYDVCVHNSLPALAILALGLLKKKEKDDGQFVWAVITHFRISGASRAYFGRFKGCYQHGYYCRKCLYSQSAWKCKTAKKNWRFCWDCLWDAILHDFSQSWHCCKLTCKRSSSIHNFSYWSVNDIMTQRR